MTNRLTGPARLLLAIFCLGCSKTLLVHSEQKNEMQSFEIAVVVTDSGVEMESHKGANWTQLDWRWGSQRDFWFDRDGCGGARDSLHGSGFRIHFEKLDKGSRLTSYLGTNWKTLTYDCGQGAPCRFTLDENGVRGATAERQ